MIDHIQIGIVSINGWCPNKQIVTKQVGQNIIMTLCGTNISKAKEWCNDDYENIDINDDGKEAPNDNDYHESQLQIPIPQLVVFPHLELLGHRNHCLRGLTIRECA